MFEIIVPTAIGLVRRLVESNTPTISIFWWWFAGITAWTACTVLCMYKMYLTTPRWGIKKQE